MEVGERKMNEANLNALLAFGNLYLKNGNLNRAIYIFQKCIETVEDDFRGFHSILLSSNLLLQRTFQLGECLCSE